MEYLNTQTVYIIFLVLVRITGMLLTAPLLGSDQIPPTVKVALSCGLTVVIAPVIVQQTHSIPTDVFIFGLIAAKELIIGLVIGFAADIIISSIQLGGEYVSFFMGLSIANVVDPVTRQNVPVVGQFYLILAWLLFLFVDGHHWLIGAVQTSFLAVPIGLDFPNINEVFQRILVLSSQMFMVALLLILPILAVSSITELALGLMAKVMPQMNIFVVGLPLKIYVGLVSIMFVMPLSKGFIMNTFQELCYYLYKLFV